MPQRALQLSQRMHGLTMIERPAAKEVRDLALKAVSELSQILHVSKGRCSDEEYERIRKGVGLAIGKIQSDVLDFVCAAYPELDDLK
jgi:hypothetical protein